MKTIETYPLSMVLARAAEVAKEAEQILWDAVLDALRKGNPRWSENMIGHSATEMAVKEIERLYAIEATVKLALRSQSDASAEHE